MAAGVDYFDFTVYFLLISFLVGNGIAECCINQDLGDNKSGGTIVYFPGQWPRRRLRRLGLHDLMNLYTDIGQEFFNRACIRRFGYESRWYWTRGNWFP